MNERSQYSLSLIVHTIAVHSRVLFCSYIIEFFSQMEYKMFETSSKMSSFPPVNEEQSSSNGQNPTIIFQNQAGLLYLNLS